MTRAGLGSADGAEFAPGAALTHGCRPASIRADMTYHTTGRSGISTAASRAPLDEFVDDRHELRFRQAPPLHETDAPRPEDRLSAFPSDGIFLDDHGRTVSRTTTSPGDPPVKIIVPSTSSWVNGAACGSR